MGRRRFYKVVNVDGTGTLWSARIHTLHPKVRDLLDVQYIPGQPAKAPEGTKLHVFSSLRLAKLFAQEWSLKSDLQVWRCSVKKPTLLMRIIPLWELSNTIVQYAVSMTYIFSQIQALYNNHSSKREALSEHNYVNDIDVLQINMTQIETWCTEELTLTTKVADYRDGEVYCGDGRQASRRPVV